MSFRLNEPVIDDDNFHSVTRLGGYGLVPRCFDTHPTGSLDGCVTYGAIKDDIPLVEWADMPALIAEKVSKKTLTSDIRLAMPGGPFTNLDQGNSNFCWAYASTHAMMISRMLASLPTVYLSGHAVGYKIKGGRNQGGWSAHSAEFIMRNGVHRLTHGLLNRGRLHSITMRLGRKRKSTDSRKGSSISTRRTTIAICRSSKCSRS